MPRDAEFADADRLRSYGRDLNDSYHRYRDGGNIPAIVTLKPLDTDLQVRDALDPRIRQQLLEHQPEQEDIDAIAGYLGEKAFSVNGTGKWSVAFSGTKEQFEATFATELRWVSRSSRDDDNGELGGLWTTEEPMQFPVDNLAEKVESIQFDVPSGGAHKASPFLDFAVDAYVVEKDVPPILNATPLHNAGKQGLGIEVCVVDSGFRTRVAELKTSTSAFDVIVDHPIEKVYGVWIPGEYPGTNYYGSGGSFNNNKIVLDKALPASETGVRAVYSCIHPHFMDSNGLRYNIWTVAADATKEWEDDKGHGTLVAAELLAVAPEANLTVISGWGAAGMAAVNSLNPAPRVINCSWGMEVFKPQPGPNQTVSPYETVMAEIASAVRAGIVVVCAGGNAFVSGNAQAWRFDTDAYTTADDNYKMLAPREAILVGGTHIKGGKLTASDGASSYDSVHDSDRHVPDIVGLCGPKPRSHLVALPTQPGSSEDMGRARAFHIPWPGVGTLPADGTAGDDGWSITSGTSTAAAEVSATVALLLQSHPQLTPNAVKNILQNSAKDVRRGASASGDKARRGWDPATGHGLIDASAAEKYLKKGFHPSMRGEPALPKKRSIITALTGRRRPGSPDIITTAAPSDDPDFDFGLTVKHRSDFSSGLPESVRHVYVRLENQGDTMGSCVVEIRVATLWGSDDFENYEHLGYIAATDLLPGEFTVHGPLDVRPISLPSEKPLVLAAGVFSDPAVPPTGRPTKIVFRHI